MDGNSIQLTFIKATVTDNVLFILCKQDVRDQLLKMFPQIEDELVKDLLEQMECKIKHRVMPFFMENNKVAFLKVDLLKDSLTLAQ